MGFFSSFFKKVKKTIKKPLSKITKGIARGVAKVGKAVMKGVSKLSNKFGPLGMIALSVAMPYALGGLNSWVGTAAMSGHHPATGLMAKKGFLGAIGKVGNTIRTGYQASTGAIGNAWSSITDSISRGFSSFTKGTGNIWKNISKGAKDLWSSSKSTAKKFTPKWRAGQSGSVDVWGLRGNVHGEGLIQSAVKSGDAMSMLQSGAIDASQISGQSLGSQSGWFTKAGSAEADNFITQTINTAMDPQINALQGNSKKYFNDLYEFQKSKGININKQETYNSIIKNKGTSYQGITDFDGSYVTDLAKTGDYTLGTARDRAAGTYNFTGGDTYNNTLGKKYINKKATSNVLKKSAFALGDSLLAGNVHADEISPIYEVANDMTMNTSTGEYSGTNLKGAYGTDYFNAVFGNAAWEKLKNNYKYMNIT